MYMYVNIITKVMTPAQAHSEVSEVGYSPSLSIIIIYILLPVLGYMDNCLEIAIYNVM